MCVSVSIKLDVYREMLRKYFGFLVFAVLEHREEIVSCAWKAWGEARNDGGWKVKRHAQTQTNCSYQTKCFKN